MMVGDEQSNNGFVTQARGAWGPEAVLPSRRRHTPGTTPRAGIASSGPWLQHAACGWRLMGGRPSTASLTRHWLCQPVPAAHAAMIPQRSWLMRSCSCNDCSPIPLAGQLLPRLQRRVLPNLQGLCCMPVCCQLAMGPACGTGCLLGMRWPAAPAHAVWPYQPHMPLVAAGAE